MVIVFGGVQSSNQPSSLKQKTDSYCTKASVRARLLQLETHMEVTRGIYSKETRGLD